jgi:SAM-dependent methyltransferase
MSDNPEFWDFYWETRLQKLDDLGKREAILTASQLIRQLAKDPAQPVRLLELGCGTGQIIGTLVQAHAQVRGITTSCGIDYIPQAIEQCRRAYPEMTFRQGDFTDSELLAGLGEFEIVLLVNALHEVFSAAYTPDLGEVDVPVAKQRVSQALVSAAERLTPGGKLVLFDGLETPGDIQRPLQIRFQHWQARRRFDTFAREYQPFRITYQESGNPLQVELSWRDFTRYITKSIFLEKHLWPTERLESYQYFNEAEFRAAFADAGLVIGELRTLTVNYEKWCSEVEIETPGVDFPQEHILIVAEKPARN